MAANSPQDGSPFLLLVIVGAIIFFATRGGSTPQPVQPDPDKPSPVVVDQKPTAEQCWEALAKCVENKWIGGTMQQHTDHIVKIVDSLKASGSITDDSRVSEWREKRTEITDANRAQIAAKLRVK